MVSTRKHPKAFPPPQPGSSPTSPDSSPSKESTMSPSPTVDSPTPAAPAATTTNGTVAKRTRAAPQAKWSHTPTHLTLLWLAVAVPLVVWDTGYILLRPHTMPGGALHWPVWAPYATYVDVDYVYGWPAFHANDGWPSAQGALNALETAAYAWYLWAAWRWGVEEGGKGGKAAAAKKRSKKGASEGGKKFWLLERRRVEGSKGAQMVLTLCVTCWITLAKTALYGLIEVFNGFAHIGHNSAFSLFFLWIVPNGAWIVFPSLILYSSSKDILRGLSIAAGVPPPSKPALL